jgi:hypothetical protein
MRDLSRVLGGAALAMALTAGGALANGAGLRQSNEGIAVDRSGLRQIGAGVVMVAPSMNTPMRTADPQAADTDTKLVQNGADNTATITQGGPSNRAELRQTGSRNRGDVVQAGRQHNAAMVGQSGPDNAAFLWQSGQRNSLEVQQMGRMNVVWLQSQAEMTRLTGVQQGRFNMIAVGVTGFSHQGRMRR